MTAVFGSLGIFACYVGIASLYLTVHKPIPAAVWGIGGLIWLGTAALQWRTARIWREVREMDDLVDHYRRLYKDGAP